MKPNCVRVVQTPASRFFLCLFFEAVEFCIKLDFVAKQIFDLLLSEGPLCGYQFTHHVQVEQLGGKKWADHRA